MFIFFLIIGVTTGCKVDSTTDQEILVGGSETPAVESALLSPRITSFIFEAAKNGIRGDIVGVISADRIIISTNKWIENQGDLIATLESVGTVTVNGILQGSGITSNDFRHEVIYTVTAEDNTERAYTVQFQCPQPTGLPVVFIDTKDDQPITSKEIYIKTNIKIIDTDNIAFCIEHNEYNDEIRGRGNSTWGAPKKPYRIKFDKKISLFGLEAAKSWVLLANYQDTTLIMNTIAFELGARLGLPFTNHAIPLEVVLNGEYQGSYVLTEQIQVGKGRVDIAEKKGFLVELDAYFDEDPKFRTDIYDLPVMIKSPEDLPDPAGYDFVKEAINGLETLMKAGDFPGNGYRELIDMDTFAKFLLINEIVKNGELGNPKSTYMYKDKDKKISMGPLWDFDWGFGYSGHYFNNPDSGNTRHAFFNRFYDDPDFIAKYKEHWNTHYNEIRGMVDFIDEQAAKLQRSQAENFRVWHTNNDYNGTIAQMKTWWIARVDYLHTEINK
jgi:spore coat protein CotH